MLSFTWTPFCRTTLETHMTLSLELEGWFLGVPPPNIFLMQLGQHSSVMWRHWKRRVNATPGLPGHDDGASWHRLPKVHNYSPDRNAAEGLFLIWIRLVWPDDLVDTELLLMNVESQTQWMISKSSPLQTHKFCCCMYPLMLLNEPMRWDRKYFVIYIASGKKGDAGKEYKKHQTGN